MSSFKIKDPKTGKWEEVPYFQGEPGTDGITPHIGANGNWFIGDADTGMPSRGADGDPGQDGHTPQRGVDYFTEADRAAMVAAVIESLGGSPIFGIVDDSNNIIVYGNLPAGTYTVKYEMEDGSTVDIGQLVLGEDEPDLPDEPVQTYTNQIPLSVDASGNPFNGGQGWKTGTRLSLGSGGESAADGYECTGFIPATKGSILRIKNVDITSENSTNIIFYDSSKNPIVCNVSYHGTTLANFFKTAEENNVYKGTIEGTIFDWTAPDNVAYIRIGSKSITADSILTVNQEIV